MHPDGGVRREVEGFCAQCRSLFNTGVPFVEQYLRKPLTIKNLQGNFQDEQNHNSDQITEDNQQSFIKVIEIGNSYKEYIENDIENSIMMLLNSLFLNFDKKSDDYIKIKIIIECLVFNLQQSFDQGIISFYKKQKLLNSNLYLCARYILHQILGNAEKQECQQKIQKIIDFNWKVLTSLEMFTQQFFSATTFSQTDCFSDVSDMYAQTCNCLAICISDEKEAASRIVTLSEIVFSNIVSVNFSILALKSFTLNEVNLEAVSFEKQNQLQSYKQLDSTSNSEIDSQINKKRREQQQITQTCLESEEFMDSLMGYIYPWCNLIQSTLLTIYSINGENEIEEYVLADHNQADSEKIIYNIQCQMFEFLDIKCQISSLDTSKVDHYIISIIKQQKNNPSLGDPLQNIQFYESIRYNLTDFGIDFKQNYLKYFSNKCSKCKSFPHGAFADLCICLICSEQLCSITCERKNIFKNEQIQKTHIGNLNEHARDKHEGKAIFFNLIENQLILIDCPMTIEYDYLYFDVIKQPLSIEVRGFLTSSYWQEHALDKQKLQLYQNMLTNRQLSNKIRSIILSPQIKMECFHNKL